MRNIFIIIIGFWIGLSSVFGQGKAIERVQNFHDRYQYKHAIEILEDIGDKNKTEEGVILLANCYRKLNDWESTEKWYRRVIDKENMSHWSVYI